MTYPRGTRMIRLGILVFVLLLIIMYIQLFAEKKISFPYDLSLSMAITNTNDIVFYILGTIFSMLIVGGFAWQIFDTKPFLLNLVITCLLVASLSAFMLLKYFYHDPTNYKNNRENIHFGLASVVVLCMGIILIIMSMYENFKTNYFLSFVYAICVIGMLISHVKGNNLMKNNGSIKEREFYSKLFAAFEISASFVFVINLVYSF